MTRRTQGTLRGWLPRGDADRWILIVALALAVASASAVGFFTARIDAAMERQAGEAIGADLRLRDSASVDATLAEAARGQGLDTARTVTFPSVVLAGDASALAGIKAVSDGYPLRGELRVAEQPFGVQTVVRRGPAPGTAWVDARLFAELGVALGDDVNVGETTLNVSKIIAYEPDRGGGFTTLAPRLMLHTDDLPATGLLGPGSRARYALLVAGPAEALARLRAQTADDLPPVSQWTTAAEARPELDSALGRARRFLGLAALSAVLLAGVAMGLAALQYAARQRESVALRKTLGATGQRILRDELWSLARLALLGGVAGVIGGYGAQGLLVAALGDVVLLSLPPAPLMPAVPALATGWIALLGFALPPLIHLRRVPPMQVLQQSAGGAPLPAWASAGAALIAVIVLLIWQAGDVLLAGVVLIGAGVGLGVMAALAWLLTAAIARLRHGLGAGWRYGLANIARRPGESVLQLVAVGLGLTVLLLLAVVRGDLLNTWRDSVPDDAPNVFLINIQADQRDAVESFFAERDLGAPTLYPMARARLTGVNGDAVSARDFDDPDARERLEREFNLSWATRLGQDNTTIDGRWWADQGAGQPWLSIEQSMIEWFGWDLGDRLTFDVAGQAVTLEVVHRREVSWDSFGVNFFLVTPPGVLDDAAATWLTSVHVTDAGKLELLDLVRAMPNVTVLDIDALIDQVRRVIDRVTLAVEAVFVLTLLAGLVVLVAALQGTRAARRREAALLRTLGASRATLRAGLLAEFGAMGVLAGLLAAILAQVIAGVLAAQVFDIAYAASPVVWLAGMAAGLVVTALAAALGVRGVVRQPPLATLR